MSIKTHKNIAVFASGSGTNAAKIFQHFKSHPQIKVNLVLCNNPKAKVIERAQAFHIPSLVFSKQIFYETDRILQTLELYKIDFIALAGFLWLIPSTLIKTYPKKIVNIHPALLPKYGGKGMFGINVHKAVVANNESTSGLTIHFVNEMYDEGSIIFQCKCELQATDTPEMVAEKILNLEHQHYPLVIEQLVLKSYKNL